MLILVILILPFLSFTMKVRGEKKESKQNGRLSSEHQFDLSSQVSKISKFGISAWSFGRVWSWWSTCHDNFKWRVVSSWEKNPPSWSPTTQLRGSGNPLIINTRESKPKTATSLVRIQYLSQAWRLSKHFELGRKESRSFMLVTKWLRGWRIRGNRLLFVFIFIIVDPLANGKYASLLIHQWSILRFPHLWAISKLSIFYLKHIGFHLTLDACACWSKCPFSPMFD